MKSKTQTQITHSLAEENYSYQLKALGFMGLETLRGVSEVPDKHDSTGERWRRNVSKIAESIQVFCFGVRCQIEADQSPDDLLLNSALFQINALGDFVEKALDRTKVEAQRGLDQQRNYVSHCGISIQDFCESIAAQICPEPSREAS